MVTCSVSILFLLGNCISLCKSSKLQEKGKGKKDSITSNRQGRQYPPFCPMVREDLDLGSRRPRFQVSPIKKGSEPSSLTFQQSVLIARPWVNRVKSILCWLVSLVWWPSCLISIWAQPVSLRSQRTTCVGSLPQNDSFWREGKLLCVSSRLGNSLFPSSPPSQFSISICKLGFCSAQGSTREPRKTH